MSDTMGIEGVIWAQPAADVFTSALTALFMVRLDKELKVLRTGSIQAGYADDIVDELG